MVRGNELKSAPCALTLSYDVDGFGENTLKFGVSERFEREKRDAAAAVAQTEAREEDAAFRLQMGSNCTGR